MYGTTATACVERLAAAPAGCTDSLEKQSGTWTTIAEYRYDARTRRVLKHVSNKPPARRSGAMAPCEGGGDQGACWQPDRAEATLLPRRSQERPQCLEERDGAGDLVARYTYSPGYIDSPALQERDLNGDGDFGDSDEVVYYHSNTLYSIYALTDGSENVVERYRYSAYGQATVLDADWSADADAASAAENPYRYTARRVDAESGLMQYRSRFYSPPLGRFVGREPTVVQTAHFYAYVAGYLTTHVDPMGTRRARASRGGGQPPGCVFIRRRVKMIKYAIAANKNRLAADLARQLYRRLAWGGDWTGKDFASDMLAHWLEGTGEPMKLSEGRVKQLITETSVKSAIAQHACRVCKQRGFSAYSGGSYTPTVATDEYYALGTFTLRFDGACCPAGDAPDVWNKLRCDGTWRVQDNYNWHEGLDIDMCGVTIPDSWALLVEEYHDAEPYPVSGQWEGSLTLDCDPGEAGDGGDGR